MRVFYINLFLVVGRECELRMFLQLTKMASLTPMYNWKRHMSVGGGHSGELADIIQNNPSAKSLCNFISISVSQVF